MCHFSFLAGLALQLSASTDTYLNGVVLIHNSWTVRGDFRLPSKNVIKKTLCQPAAGQQNFTKQASKPLHIEKLEFLISLAVLDANYDTRRI